MSGLELLGRAPIWHRVYTGRHKFDPVTATTTGMGEGGAALPAGSNGVLNVIYLDPADYPAGAKMRIELLVLTDETAPGVSFIASLYSVANPSGTGTAPLDTEVSGSEATVTTPALNTKNRAISTEFNVPAAGYYAQVIEVTGAGAANSAVGVRISLQVKA